MSFKMEFSAFISVIAISMIASSISVNSALPMADDPAAHGPKSVLNPRSPLAASINVGTTKNSPMGYMDSTPLQPIQVEQSNSACLVSQFLESVDEDMPPTAVIFSSEPDPKTKWLFTVPETPACLAIQKNHLNFSWVQGMQKYELKLTKSIDLEKDIGIRSFSGKCLLNFYCILSRASDSRMAFTLNFTVRGVNDFHPRFNTSRITIKAAKSSAKVPLVTLSQWVTDEDILEGGRIKTFRFGGNENETFFKFLDPVKGIVTFNTSIDFEEIPKNKTLSVPVQVVDDGDLSGWSTLVVTIVESPLTFSSKLYMIYTTYDYVGPLDTVPSPIRAFDRSSDDGQILYSLREGRGTDVWIILDYFHIDMTTGVVIKRRPVHNIFKDVLWASVLAQKMPSGKWQSRVPLGIVMRQEISNPPLHRSVTEIKPIALGSVVSVVALLAVGTGYYVVVKNRSRQ